MKAKKTPERKIYESFGTAIGLRFVTNPSVVGLVNAAQTLRMIELMLGQAAQEPEVKAALAVMEKKLRRKRHVDVEVRMPLGFGGVRFEHDTAAHAEWSAEQQRLWDAAAKSC